MSDGTVHKLNMTSQMVMDEYLEKRDIFITMERIVHDTLQKMLQSNSLTVTAMETRIKTESSLRGKLILKGYKYQCLSDLTDILGARIITFYNDDIDKVSALVSKHFDVDWKESVDKRKMHELDSFGYMSLHYICSIPKNLYYDEAHPEINVYRFEIQMRSALQHVWANMYHDTGYKTGIEIPLDYLRSLNRLAGILELADDEFSRIRRDINNYRRQVSNLIHSGKFDDIPLSGDSFRSYLELKPFDSLLQKIAAINQAEILENSARPYFAVFVQMNFTNLGDIERMIKNYSNHAYQLALSEIGETDLDIISSTVAVQDLCAVYLVENGYGTMGLQTLFELTNGKNNYNENRAARVMERIQNLSFMKEKK